MKLVIDLPSNQVERIKSVIEASDYLNAGDFVSTAVENQLELEGAESASIKSLEEAVSEIPHQDNLLSRDYLDLFRPPRSHELSSVEYPSSARLESGPLWGQYNRIFPVKLVLRSLANSVFKAQDEDENEDGRGIILEDFADETGYAAREVGLEIKRVDEKKERGRGKKLSSGLPVGDKPQKSIQRFKSHFIGYSDRNNLIKGAPAQLLFANISKDDPMKIGITKSGLEFATLSNPLLDEHLESDEPFSEEEREYYLSHVMREVPEEFGAMELVAECVEGGINRPKELSNEISKLNDNWSEAQANTMRTGLVSRMVEMGLLNRSRVGQRGISYQLTNEGENHLNFVGEVRGGDYDG